MRDELAKHGRAAVAIAALGPIVFLPLVLYLHPENWQGTALLLAAVSAFLSVSVVLVLGLIRLAEHARLRWVSRRLPERTFSRGPSGPVVHGRIDGVRVTLERRTLAVEVASAFEGHLDRRQLMEVASASSRPMLARLAGEPQARSAAARLVALTGRDVRVRIEPGRAWIHGFPAGRTVEIARALAALAGTRAFHLARSSAAATCPYCHDNLGARESEGTIRCPDCDSLHHTPCWREHGGCAIHGCARTPERPEVVAVPDAKARA